MQWTIIQQYLLSHQFVFVIALLIDCLILFTMVLQKVIQTRKESKITNLFDEDGNKRRKNYYELPVASCILFALVILSLWLVVRAW